VDSFLHFGGRLYSISVTRTNGVPVSTVVPTYQPAGTVQPLAASNPTATAATLHAVANPTNGGAMSVWFEYGTDPNLTGAWRTLNTIVPNGGEDVAVSACLRGLSPATTYFFRTQTDFTGNPQSLPGVIMSFQTTSSGNTANPLTLTPLSNGRRLLQLYGMPGRPYVVRKSPDLSSWLTLGTITPGPDSILVYEDDDETSVGKSFYQVVRP
jgi:hypothetical protein